MDVDNSVFYMASTESNVHVMVRICHPIKYISLKGDIAGANPEGLLVYVEPPFPGFKDKMPDAIQTNYVILFAKRPDTDPAPTKNLISGPDLSLSVNIIAVDIQDPDQIVSSKDVKRDYYPPTSIHLTKKAAERCSGHEINNRR